MEINSQPAAIVFQWRLSKLMIATVADGSVIRKHELDCKQSKSIITTYLWLYHGIYKATIQKFTWKEGKGEWNLFAICLFTYELVSTILVYD
jgi:hypothetical protein